jgi:hypothetical protein
VDCNTTLNHKLSQKSVLRAGAIFNNIHFDYYQKSRANDNAPLLEVINTKKQHPNGTRLCTMAVQTAEGAYLKYRAALPAAPVQQHACSRPACIGAVAGKQQ